MIRASISIEAKSCKIEKKNTSFNTFWPQKNTHISGCKIVHKCTSATVTVHICTVIVTLAFNILHFFSLSFASLSHFQLLTLTSLFLSLVPQSTDQSNLTLTYQSSKPPLMNKSQHRHWWANHSTAKEEQRSKPLKKQVMPPLLLPCRRRSPPKLTHRYDLRSSHCATTDRRWSSIWSVGFGVLIHFNFFVW